MERKTASPARAVAYVGIMAATLECVKLALAFLPNIEGVTLLCALYGYVFGLSGALAALVFVTIEPLIYGFGTWVLAYYIHWPSVAIIFMLLRKARIKNRWIISGVAVLLTAWFGILTSLVEVGLFTGFFDDFFKRFAIYYTRGAVFYMIQIACNAVLFPLLFKFAAEKLDLIRSRFN